MDWSNVGSISEIISAIAIVGSLAYIAAQIRLTRLAAEAQGTIDTLRIYSRWRLAMMGSSDLANIVDKANTGKELSGAERIRLATLSDELIISASVAYTSGAQTGIVHEQQGEIDYLTGILERNPGVIPEWHRSKHIINTVSTQFVDTIDDHLARAANT